MQFASCFSLLLSMNISPPHSKGKLLDRKTNLKDERQIHFGADLQIIH